MMEGPLLGGKFWPELSIVAGVVNQRRTPSASVQFHFHTTATPLVRPPDFASHRFHLSSLV